MNSLADVGARPGNERPGRRVTAITRVKRVPVVRRSSVRVLLTAGLAAVLLVPGGRAAASPLAPSAPSNLVALSWEPTVHLSWDAAQANVAPIDHYNVYRSCSSCETRVTNVGNVTSFEDTDAIGGTTYTYEVAAVNNLGEEGPRASADATPAVPGLPGPPRDLNAENTYSKNHYGTLLTWNAPDNDGGTKILHYRIYRNVGEGWTLLDHVGGSTFEYEDRHGHPDDYNCDMYVYFVAAVNGNGEGPGSDVVSHGPVAFACDPQ